MKSEKLNDLLGLIAFEDKDALAELYKQYSNIILIYAMSIVRDVHLAEDIMQDVFIKVGHNASKYKSNKNAYAWILTVTRNQAFDVLRKRKKESVGFEFDIQGTNNETSIIDRLFYKRFFKQT